jgi:hypothetical protein
MAVDLLSILPWFGICNSSNRMHRTNGARGRERLLRESDGESEIVSKNLKRKVVF